MNILRILLFGAFLLVTLTGLCVCRMEGKGHESFVPIMRNIVWNDFVSQIRFLPDDSAEDSFAKGTLTVQRFLKAHATETRIGIYDLEVFRAIDHARVCRRPIWIGKSSETNCPTGKSKQSSGGEPCNSQPSSAAANVMS